MCGRFTLRTPARDIAQAFGVSAPDTKPRYNVAPSQAVAAVRNRPAQDTREFVMLRWGLIPFWADGPQAGYKMVNARAETVATKPAFRKAFAQRRCLILADGFYEWQKAGSGKQPFLIHMKDDRLFAFAGLWERWEREDEAVESCTIIVTEANDLVTPIHDRMPVILDPADYDVWLDSTYADRKRLQAMLKPFPSSELEAYPVSRTVNSPKNDSAECVERLHD